MTDGVKTPSESLTSERCYVREHLNTDAVPDVSLAACRVCPGVTTQLHALSVHEWYVIRTGQGLMHVGADEPFTVGPGDTVSIPPGRDQQISNTGDEDLLFFCVCVPRFTPDCYTSRE